jgi:hypothetical protein
VTYSSKEAEQAYRKAYYEANKEKRKEADKAYYEANKEKRREQAKAYREANREKYREVAKVYYEANKEKCREIAKVYYEANREKYREAKKAYREANREKRREAGLLTGAKQRAKAKGLEFNIDKEDVIIPEVCPVLGLRLVQGSGGHHAGSPSLDRIDPSKGYIKGNVRVISYRANLLKSDATLEELELILADARRLASFA